MFGDLFHGCRDREIPYCTSGCNRAYSAIRVFLAGAGKAKRDPHAGAGAADSRNLAFAELRVKHEFTNAIVE